MGRHAVTWARFCHCTRFWSPAAYRLVPRAALQGVAGVRGSGAAGARRICVDRGCRRTKASGHRCQSTSNRVTLSQRSKTDPCGHYNWACPFFPQVRGSAVRGVPDASDRAGVLLFVAMGWSVVGGVYGYLVLKPERARAIAIEITPAGVARGSIVHLATGGMHSRAISAARWSVNRDAWAWARNFRPRRLPGKGRGAQHHPDRDGLGR